MNNSKSVPRHIPLSFYGTGIDHSFPAMESFKKQPNAFNDQSANVLSRNLHSVHTKEYESMREKEKILRKVNEINKERNNYMTPSHNIITSQEVPIDINNRAFQFQKEKAYSKETTTNNLHKGQSLPSDRFLEEKKLLKKASSAIDMLSNNDPEQYFPRKTLNRNYLYLNQKSSKDYIKYLSKANTTRGFNESSKEGPKWMKLKCHKSRNVQHNLNIFPSANNNNDDNIISVFSKFQDWITVARKDSTRSQAFEKFKYDREKQNKIRPEWMHSTHWDNKPKEHDPFISLPYNTTIHSKSNKPLLQTLLIDKSNKTNTSKSIFSYGDYRHNVPFNSNIIQYEQGISKFPKQFFN